MMMLSNCQGWRSGGIAAVYRQGRLIGRARCGVTGLHQNLGPRAAVPDEQSPLQAVHYRGWLGGEMPGPVICWMKGPARLDKSRRSVTPEATFGAHSMQSSSLRAIPRQPTNCDTPSVSGAVYACQQPAPEQMAMPIWQLRE